MNKREKIKRVFKVAKFVLRHIDKGAIVEVLASASILGTGLYNFATGAVSENTNQGCIGMWLTLVGGLTFAASINSARLSLETNLFRRAVARGEHGIGALLRSKREEPNKTNRQSLDL